MLGFVAQGARFALFVGIGLFAGMTVREVARARMAVLLGDPTPRLWGRLSLNPKSWFDPFGSAFVPGLILLLIATSAPYFPPFAYAKPAPIDPRYLKHGSRDIVLVSCAGPAANILLAFLPGLWLRTGVPAGTLGQFLVGLLIANLSLAVMHLVPIPGLDGARMVGLLLHGRAKALYRDLDAYLPLFTLGLFLIFGVLLGPALWRITLTACRGIAGSSVCV
ncbi:MAG: site-2 protease family protein [Actinomycetota bacterium]